MKPTVLIVEDNADHAWLAMREIKKSDVGYDIIHFENGEELLDYLNTNLNALPAFILLDMHMPSLTGLQVLRKLKKDEHYQSIPVIMLTSSTQEKDIIESYALGAASYIVKPLNNEKFMNAVTNLDSFVTVPVKR